jgi:hypothetical protein
MRYVFVISGPIIFHCDACIAGIMLFRAEIKPIIFTLFAVGIIGSTEGYL